jgi:hypothetical protein
METLNNALHVATIFDQEHGGFGLEYDNSLGKKNTMRLDASTYERAIREAKSFLGVSNDDSDADGHRWVIE